MNRLKDETSPYLLQHADNPVDWYPWGEEAFTVAQREDKPILLSVGYSACHWCHVMAHESFEHEPTAELMNRLFVNIKVDREERPDIDEIYMTAVQTLTRSGGWPMTVFCLPDGRPFHGGTYYPREPRYGMPSFRQVLEAVYDAYVNRREEVERAAESLANLLNRDVLAIGAVTPDYDAPMLDQAAQMLLANFDRKHGGFGGAPKFPNPMNLEFLLRTYLRTGNAELLHAVTFTLEKMARGGIYDQLGGGFHRYSVDAIWLVPHFEKMLYDNAQLSRLYLHAWQVTKEPFHQVIAEDIYDYILREMTAPEGGFYSATDADSEGVEGKFFVWSKAELEEILGDDAPIAIEYWGVTTRGNFEGHNILHVPNNAETVAERLQMSVEELQERLTRVKDKLFAARTQRVAPLLDDKILASWNGLMLASLAEAARVLKRDDYLIAAERAGEFILNHMTTDKGRLYRSYRQGRARFNAYLEDYANLIDAMLELYQATFDIRWYRAAVQFSGFVLEHFRADDGGFFDTSDDHEKLIVRPRNLQDNATPSGNAMMAKQLLRLAAYTGDSRYDDAARATLAKLTEAVRQYPQAFGEALNAIDSLVTGLTEVALVGNPVEPQMRALLDILSAEYRSNVVVALTREDMPDEAEIPLLSHRTRVDGLPAAYVCRQFTCKMPVTDVEALQTQLNESS